MIVPTCKRPRCFRPLPCPKHSAKPEHQKLYNYEWQRKRQRFLEAHQFCRECRDAGRIERATVVDHIVPHRGNLRLFWDEANWQPLCVPCHNAKSRRERE